MSTQQITPPQELLDLIARFEEHVDVYRSGHYNEAQVRREFIDPFFAVLGWDIDNKANYAEQYKEVIHEDAIRVGGLTKAPDYCFRIGGTRKFFVEAKKPSVNIREDISAAYQVRRYAWSAKLPLSVLCDFEEFAVYDCRKRPEKGDSPAVGRILYMTYREYERRWSEIASVFSRDAILRGSFDKFAETTRGKRGTAEVDDAFLEEIESWRIALARNLAIRNPALSQRELNFAVQRTIDRIIFLRICEDRGIEPYGQLQGLMNGNRVYPRLCDIYDRADDRYNSGLFHFASESDRPEAPDQLSKRLALDDKVLKDIIKRLYYPESPYEFSVLPADILGQVYEQFLGKVIRLTAGHQAKVEEKPEVKKAGGVYYTPTYIVDYIVANTVGKLLEGKTPKTASGLRILDPACGSGSFLIGAYQHLLDWHLKYYLDGDPEKYARGRNPALVHTSGGWRLTTTERKRILTNNIYGVDIDSQAVEVTKLSLLLKVLEGETEASLSVQRRMLERALPDLGGNIKCGNSLIGPDFYSGQQLTLLDDEEIYRINVFDWNSRTEGFGAIMEAGGFDAVIGNPPWGAEFSPLEIRHFSGFYDTGRCSNTESYALFAEAALRQMRHGGLLSFITPDTFLRKDDYLPLRKIVVAENSAREIVETGPVFRKVRDTWCAVFQVGKCPPEPANMVTHKQLSRFTVSAEDRLLDFYHSQWIRSSTVPQSLWRGRPKMIVGYLSSGSEQSAIRSIEKYPALGDLRAEFRISRGEEGGKAALAEDQSGSWVMVTPADVERYHVGMGLRVSGARLAPAKVSNYYSFPKIWVIRIQKMRWRQRLVSGVDLRSQTAGLKTLQIIVSADGTSPPLLYLQGIIASRLINFWCVNYLADDMNQSYLERLPIRTIDFNDPADVARHDRMVALVECMLDLNPRLAAANLDREKAGLRRQIDATDRQIDELVYELYGLDADEIALVENGT